MRKINNSSVFVHYECICNGTKFRFDNIDEAVEFGHFFGVNVFEVTDKPIYIADQSCSDDYTFRTLTAHGKTKNYCTVDKESLKFMLDEALDDSTIRRINIYK